MINLNIFEKIEYWSNHNIYITYEIIDQIHNGNREGVSSEDIPLMTYTVYVADTEDGYNNYIYACGTDNINDCLEQGVKVVEYHFKNLMTDHYKLTNKL